MFLRIQPASPLPVYRQIMDQVSYQIASGTLRSGDRLPSVRELAALLPANQNTVLKAYDLLARQGLVDLRRGDGTFVAAPETPAMKKSHRLKQVAPILAQAAAMAVHLEISGREIHELLDQEIRTLEKGGPAHD